MRFRYCAPILLLAGLAASNVWGEAAQMRGKFPAAVREANFLDAVAVGRFGGRDGGQFEVMLEQQIGRPNTTPDGFVTGQVTTNLQTNGYKGSEERCVEWKDGKVNGECLKRARVDVPCTRRTIDLVVSVRLIRATGNQPLWSDNRNAHNETSWCEGKQPSTSPDSQVQAMLRDIAMKLRYDLRPYYDQYKVRFREDRDGMPKDVGGDFKEVVKLSQKDIATACRQWALLNDRLPNNASILYNLGVCAEANGAYPDAMTMYRAAQSALPKRSGDMTDSVNRVARLMQAQADDQERARRRRG